MKIMLTFLCSLMFFAVLSLFCLFALGQGQPARYGQVNPKEKIVHQKKGLKAVVKTTSTGHSVNLTCTPAIPVAPVTGYYFYRGTAPGQESATALNTLSPTCTFTDTTVVGLTTYYYTAKSYDPGYTSPGLSVPSNEITVSVPADSQPPAPVLSVGTVSKNHVPLFWKTLPARGVQIESHNVFRCYQSNCPNPPKIAQTTSSTYLDTNTGTKEWWYQVSDNDIINHKPVVSPKSNTVAAKF